MPALVLVPPRSTGLPKRPSEGGFTTRGANIVTQSGGRPRLETKLLRKSSAEQGVLSL